MASFSVIKAEEEGGMIGLTAFVFPSHYASLTRDGALLSWTCLPTGSVNEFFVLLRTNKDKTAFIIKLS